MSDEMRIRQCWDRLFGLNHAIGQNTAYLFGLGASVEAIAAGERELGFALPEEIKAGCRAYNGVDQAWDGCSFHKLEDIPQQLEYCRNEAAECPPFRCAAGVQPPQFGARLIPFASGLDDTAYCIDLNPGADGKAGQVSAVCFADASIEAAAGSYVEFLEQGVQKRQTELDRKRRRARAKQGNQPGTPDDSPVDSDSKDGLLGCLLSLPVLLTAGVLSLLMLAVLRFQRLPWPWRLRHRMGKRGTPGLSPSTPRGEPQHPPKTRMPATPGSIAALWYEIEDLNRAQGFDANEQFFAGATEQQLAELEQSLGRRLPEDLRELFRACAACAFPWTDEKREYAGFAMQDIPQTIAGMQALLDPMPKLRLYPGTRPPLPGANLIPIEDGAPCLCYDLNPGEGGVAGQIVDVDLEAGSCKVQAASLKALLEQGIANLKKVRTNN